MNVLIQFELLVFSLKPPCLGNKPRYMPCLAGASNVFLSLVELQVFVFLFYVKFPFFNTEKIHYPHSRIPTGEQGSLHYQTPVWFIHCSNTAAGTATTRPMVCFPHWRVSSCSALWVVRFFKNGGGGLLQNLMLEGDPEVPFTSPSAISHSHMALTLAEQSGRSTSGRETGWRNLFP